MTEPHFSLKVFDNFQYGESYLHGKYGSYEEALRAAEMIVEEFIESNHKPGMSAAELAASFALYGEEAVVLDVTTNRMDNRFSARKYAALYSQRYCDEQNQPT